MKMMVMSLMEIWSCYCDGNDGYITLMEMMVVSYCVGK